MSCAGSVLPKQRLLLGHGGERNYPVFIGTGAKPLPSRAPAGLSLHPRPPRP